MPTTDPTAHLVMVQSDLAVAGLEKLFDAAPLLLGADRLTQGNLGGGVGRGVVRSQLAHRAHHDQPPLGSNPALLLGPHSHRQGVDLERPLLPGLGRGRAWVLAWSLAVNKGCRLASEPARFVPLLLTRVVWRRS